MEKIFKTFKLTSILKFLFAIIPLLWIFGKINFSQLFATFLLTPWWLLPSFTAAVSFMLFLQGLRWWLLVKAFVPSFSFKSAMLYHLKSMYYSMMLPTGAAHDIVKAVLVSRTTDYSVVWGATWIAKLLGLFGLALICIVGLFKLKGNQIIPATGAYITLASCLLLALLTGLSFSKKTTSPLRNLVGRIIPSKAMKIVESLRDGVYRYKSKPVSVMVVLLLTLLMQFCLVINASIVIKALSGRFFFYECLAFIPLIEILTLVIPITPNGIGIRDALSAAMFHHFGLSYEQLGIYVVIGFYSIALKIAGGIPIAVEFFLVKKLKKHPTTS